MKKILIIASLVLAIGIFSGCGKKASETQSQDSKAGGNSESQGGVISSIKEAMGLGKAMECTYSYKAGEQTFTSKMFVEGKKYKSENEIMGKKQISIFDGETMYNWSDVDKKGFKWTKSCMEELNKSYTKDDKEEKDDIAEVPAGDITKDAEEAFKDALDTKCVSASSIDFTIPSDITFADQCEVMKEQMKKMEDMKNNLPTDVKIPEGMNIPNQ